MNQHKSTINHQPSTFQEPLCLFVCGDVMTGRGIDQILPHPCAPQLFESYVHDARDYLKLAQATYGPIPHPTPYDYIWGEAQIHFAHCLIDEGVDLVHGHSSHHAKALEIYRGRPILYGCGDFLTDYEGIGGYEAFRGDLAIVYLIRLVPLLRRVDRTALGADAGPALPVAAGLRGRCPVALPDAQSTRRPVRRASVPERRPLPHGPSVSPVGCAHLPPRRVLPTT